MVLSECKILTLRISNSLDIANIQASFVQYQYCHYTNILEYADLPLTCFLFIKDKGFFT